MPPHPLTNFEIQKYQNESIFNGVCSRDNLQKIKDGAYEINLDQYSDIGTYWVALYCYNKSIKKKFKIQAYDSIMCGYFYIGFIDFMFAGKTLTEFTNLFLPDKLKEMMI